MPVSHLVDKPVTAYFLWPTLYIWNVRLLQQRSKTTKSAVLTIMNVICSHSWRQRYSACCLSQQKNYCVHTGCGAATQDKARRRALSCVLLTYVCSTYSLATDGWTLNGRITFNYLLLMTSHIKCKYDHMHCTMGVLAGSSVAEKTTHQMPHGTAHPM